MRITGIAAFLLSALAGLLPCAAEPVRHRDLNPASPWAAHLDVAKLGDPAIEDFLLKVSGFDRVMGLKAIFNDQLALDWRSITGVTLYGVGEKATATAIILRGNFAGARLDQLTNEEDLPVCDGIQLKRGPEWQGHSLIIAVRSDKEWVAGTSVKAVQDGLDRLAGRAEAGKAPVLTPFAAKELAASAAMFAIDMKKINGQVDFEADFTRAVQRGWFLIGSNDDLVEATVMIESTDAEGLAFLQQQLQASIGLLSSRTDLPSVWRELAGAVKIDQRGNWMTVKVAASPDQSVTFIKSLEQFFVAAPQAPEPDQ